MISESSARDPPLSVLYALYVLFLPITDYRSLITDYSVNGFPGVKTHGLSPTVPLGQKLQAGLFSILRKNQAPP